MNKELFQKIKVGDLVKVREDLEELYENNFSEDNCFVVKSMLRYAGTTHTVTGVRSDSGSVYGITFSDVFNITWTPSMIEKVIKHTPEKCLTKEEFANLKVGDKVKLVDLRPLAIGEQSECHQSFVEPMEKYLGKTFKIKEIFNKEEVTLEGATSDNLWCNWKFTREMIEKKVENVDMKQSENFIDFVITAAKVGIKAKENQELHLSGGINKDTYITNVFYNNPFTVVKFSDGTTTKCKCEKSDIYDKEKGFAICIMKKCLGNKQAGEMLIDWTDTKASEVNLTDIRKKQKAKAKEIAQTKAAEKAKKEYEAAKNL